MKFIIDRSKWLRGEGADPSRLLRVDDGKMCCLGQVAVQCGIHPEDLEDKPAPSDLNRTELFRLPEWLLSSGKSFDSNDCTEAMRINDQRAITDEERERRLIALFAKHNTELQFTDNNQTNNTKGTK